MKKRRILGMLLCLSLFGCGAKETQTDDLNEMEYYEEYEGLSDEEATRLLIEEANQQEVVPDKTE